MRQGRNRAGRDGYKLIKKYGKEKAIKILHSCSEYRQFQVSTH